MRFSDGEISIQVDAPVRNDHVFVIQSTCSPVNDNTIELLLLIRTLKRASAQRICVVVPYVGYFRQDASSIFSSSASCMASDIAQLIEAAGADELITLDLHSGQIEGFFRLPLENIQSARVFVPELLRQADLRFPLVVVAPSAKSVGRVRPFLDCLTDAGFTHRLAVIVRDLGGKTDAGNPLVVDKPLTPAEIIATKSALSMYVVGSECVAGADCVIVDDIAFTGNTILTAARELVERHGARSVRVCVTHPMLTADGVFERLEAAPYIAQVFTTDSVPLRAPLAPDSKIVVLSCAELLAGAIVRSFSGEALTTSDAGASF